MSQQLISANELNSTSKPTFAGLYTTGNVGIGTSNPQTKIHVVGTDGSVPSFPTIGVKDFLIVENNNNSNVNLINGGSAYSSALKATISGGTGPYSQINQAYNSGSPFISFNLLSNEYMRLTSAGYLGIGTNSPISLLSLASGTGDTSTNDTILSWSRTSSTGNVLGGKWVLEAKPSDPTNYGNLVARIKSTASSAESTSYYTDALIIDGSSGNLGLGTASPASYSGYKTFGLNATNGSILDLQVNATSTGRVQSDSSQGLGLYTLTSSPVVFYTNNTERMRITSSGQLLLGNTSSSYNMQIYAPGTAASVLQFASGVTGPGAANGLTVGLNASGNAVFQHQQAYSLLFGVGGGTNMTLDSNGNLGLGVTPSAWASSFRALQIGTSGVNSILNMSAPAGAMVFNAYYNGTNYLYQNSSYAGRFDFNYSASGGFTWNIAPSGTAANTATFTQAMTLDYNGILCVGATSNTSRGGTNASLLTYKASGTNYLDIQCGSTGSSGLLFSASAGSAYGLVNYDNSASVMQFYTNSAERARIDTSGNLMIGTTSPGSSSKVTIIQSSSTAPVRFEQGPNGSQGAACWTTIVQSYPVVSSGTQLIIPFVSQGNLNSTTMVRVRGMSARYNSNAPLPFTAEFALGHLSALYNLTSWNVTGNASGVSASGMNIIISFTTAYTSSTQNGIFVVIEYLTNVPGYSINVGSIAMN